MPGKVKTTRMPTPQPITDLVAHAQPAMPRSETEFTEETRLFGADLAPIAAASLEAAIRLCRMCWEKNTDADKWGYALLASAYLRKRAGWSGLPNAALAAVEIIATSGPLAPDAVEQQNQLGLALQSFGELDEAPNMLENAIDVYNSALTAVIRQKAPLVSRLRIELNLAAAWYSLGKLTDHNAEPSARRHRFRKSLFVLLRTRHFHANFSLEDRSRFAETFGILMITREYWNSAIRALEIAKKILPISPAYQNDHIRILGNIGAAYTANWQYKKACLVYEEALNLLTSERKPYVWSEMQTKYGYALLGLSSKPDQDSAQTLTAAVKAFEQGRLESSKSANRLLWGENRTGLGVALQLLGAQKTDSRNSLETQIDGLSHLLRVSLVLGGISAITIKYNECIDQIISQTNSVINSFYALFDAKYGMASTLKYKARILALLDELGLPAHERAAILSEIAAEVAASAKRLPSEVVQRLPRDELPHANRPDKPTPATTSRNRTKRDRPLPTLPAGLAWPTETFSSSPEAKRGGGGIVAYLERVWLPLLEAAPWGLDLRTLRTVDQSAAKGIDNYTQAVDRTTGKPRLLPQHILKAFPTLKQMNDASLAAGVVTVSDAPRLGSAARRRRLNFG